MKLITLVSGSLKKENYNEQLFKVYLGITSKYMTVMHPVLDHVNVAVLQCNDIKGMCNYCLASDVNEKEANVSPQLGKVLMLFLASYGCRYNFEKFHLFLSFCARCYRLEKKQTPGSCVKT